MTSPWSPDSCSIDQPGLRLDEQDRCIVEVDENFQFVSFIKKCSAHASLEDNQAGMNTLLAENQRGPSNALREILDNAPTAMFDILEGERQFKRNINITYNITGTVPNRILNLTISGISPTQAQKNGIQTKIDNRFGSGRITITWA